jgi:hypothetical protein
MFLSGIEFGMGLGLGMITLAALGTVLLLLASYISRLLEKRKGADTPSAMDFQSVVRTEKLKSFPHENRSTETFSFRSYWRWEGWKLVHKCCHCGDVISLQQIEAWEIADETVPCDRCGCTGPINIQIRDADRPVA